MKAVIMVGLPSSGKSTYSKELGIRIISKDIIREAFPTMKEPDVRKLETQEIKDCALL
jgi:tRNA uridine 5-carbamoylmethylation protein Kti12